MCQVTGQIPAISPDTDLSMGHNSETDGFISLKKGMKKVYNSA